MTRERREGEGTVTQTEAAATPARAKASARGARSGKTLISEKADEKGSVSQSETRTDSSEAKPGGRAARSRQSEISKNLGRQRDPKPELAAGGPAPGAASTRARRQRAAGLRRRVPGKTAAPRATEPQLEAVTKELRTVNTLLQQLVPPPRLTDASGDTVLEGAVNSLRRLLSELIEERMEAVVRDLAQLRTEATSPSSDTGGRVVARLDQLLESLGALKFEARRFDAIDPLIHIAVEERHEEALPDGVVLVTVRPGFRSGRGAVLCKAAVAVNRRG